MSYEDEIPCTWSGFGIIYGDKIIRYREVFFNMQCYYIHEYALVYYLSWLL